MTDDDNVSTGDTGSVRPLDEFGNPIPTPDSAPPRRRRPWTVFAGAALAVVAVGVAGGWLWWANVIRGPLGAAEVVPGSADMVFTVDALELIEGDRFIRLIEAFDTDDEIDFNIDELISDADDEIEAETGLRILGDVREWIGRSAALAVWIPADVITTLDPEVDVVASIMTRDEGAARDFLDDVVATANLEGAEIETITISGVEVYSIPNEVPALVTVHSGRVLIASDPGRMSEMIDPTDTITERSAYQRLWDAVDGEDAFASMYVSQNFLDDFVQAAFEASGAEPTGVPTGAFLGTATLDDDGVEFSGATITLDDSTQTDPGTWGRELPSGAYGYVSAALPFDPADVQALYDEQIAALEDVGLGGDIEDFEVAFYDTFDLTLRDLLGQFTDELLFAALPSDLGPLPALSGGPLGIGMAVGLDDAARVANALAQLPEFLGPDGDVLSQTPDGRWVLDLGDGAVFTYGVVEDRLVIATDPDTIDGLLGRGLGSVEEDAEWQRLAALIGEDMVVYVDIAGVVGAFAPADIAADLAPLRSFGASGAVEDGVSIVQMRLVIDY